jgi:hypothetical protein
MEEAMPLKLMILAFVVGLVFFLFVLSVLRSRAFRPSFAFLWLCISVFLLSVPLFEGFYRWLAINVLGLDAATYLVFIAVIGFLMVYVFFMTIRMTQMADKVQALISYTAILEKELNDLRTRSPE